MLCKVSDPPTIEPIGRKGVCVYGIDHIPLRIKGYVDMLEMSTIVTQPLVIMIKDEDGEISCHLHPDQCDHRHYGLPVCDLVRHVAAAFKVRESDVWEWGDKERQEPTTQFAYDR
jgi:hypothetical protein